MRKKIKRSKVLLSLFILSFAIIAPTLVNAFQEGWENSPVGTYSPDTLPLAIITADEGDWILSDTVSEFPDCGPTPHKAEILLSGGDRSLRLTSGDSNSSCADNVSVNLLEVPQLNLNTGFSVPLTSGTIISFEEVGNLISPETGSPYCILAPCGDTISLILEDTRGNILAYVLQRAADAVPNEAHSYYREVFLDPNAGDYARNLFADFNTIPDFNSTGATIRAITFRVDKHGIATIDNICIGTSVCSLPPSANFSGLPRSGFAPLSVNFLDESTGNITSWSWDFGDGSVSTAQNPSHTYSTPGSYTVSLKVTGPDGSNTKTSTNLITVNTKPLITSPVLTLLLLSDGKKISPEDQDKDGYTVAQGDCNDSNATVYPGATEICGDGIDQDCSGSDLTCVILTVTSAGQIWMDRNLGASRVATSSDDSQAYGDLYQWGRGTDGHEKRTSSTTSVQSTKDSPGHDSFIIASSSYSDWRTPQNDNLWQGVSGTNNPCPAGFRLPTATELDAEMASWTIPYSAGAFASPLKLVVAGFRYGRDGSLLFAGSSGSYSSSTVYWSSAVYASSRFDLYFRSDYANVSGHVRAGGSSVRCLKD